ncbi:2-amino-4-hydroxy-6-hydroxymethyldihydropteridine diphosphokinase [Aliikangiella marina]|uniref:2-amino-4-hydroxy-6-hydroxymethyldihydropteridine diphosphokinase n=1 Tax=Aliikangiella marina TaxID=1712262 RepID=A0A545TCC4_9GAMM|nr:2-amino-4-hydroxy-6-hydroxymethyldihydropteridine diphosphokinase [Aliikangiella marina]TQV74868.1 2-amino-4-hydroxy-6-hydroxymethyldihydropteridine diphosphokinase [Aliikangiella marina]
MIVYLGVGSNIDADHHINIAKQAIQTYYPSSQFSRTFESEAVGFVGDNFLNLVAEIETSTPLEQLIEDIKHLEDQLGRVRGGEKFSSRTIDIDILLYGDLICEKPIVLPRDEILENAYVLWPLSEMRPLLKVPGSNQTYSQKWQAFNKDSQKIVPLDKNG